MLVLVLVVLGLLMLVSMVVVGRFKKYRGENTPKNHKYTCRYAYYGRIVLRHSSPFCFWISPATV